jgi:hypothetical protein
MKGFLQWVAMLALVLCALIGAERIPILKRMDTSIREHRKPLVTLTLAMTILGFAVFMGGAVYYSIKSGRPPGDGGVEETARQGMYAKMGFSRYWFWGRTWSRGFSDEFSIHEAKTACSRWWSELRWQRAFVIGTAALTMGFGLFGVIGVLSPVSVKVLIAGALLYALARSAWAVLRA